MKMIAQVVDTDSRPVCNVDDNGVIYDALNSRVGFYENEAGVVRISDAKGKFSGRFYLSDKQIIREGFGLIGILDVPTRNVWVNHQLVAKVNDITDLRIMGTAAAAAVLLNLLH